MKKKNAKKSNVALMNVYIYIYVVYAYMSVNISGNLYLNWQILY